MSAGRDARQDAGRTVATVLPRGVYLHPANGRTAYLGTLVLVIGSDGTEAPGLSCHIPDRAEERAAIVSRICAELDRIDPPHRRA